MCIKLDFIQALTDTIVIPLEPFFSLSLISFPPWHILVIKVQILYNTSTYMYIACNADYVIELHKLAFQQIVMFMQILHKQLLKTGASMSNLKSARTRFFHGMALLLVRAEDAN